MKLHYEDEQIALYHADCRDLIASLPDNSVDAIVTDPPYELSFLGNAWDKTGIAFDPDFWADLLRVAKPGANLAAFGHPRTWHRLAAAIEDAGWVIQDSIAWLHAEGKPQHESRLKPAFEPIVLARKGTQGELHVSRCRVGDDSDGHGRVGRWPTNVLLSQDAADLLDEEAGERPSGGKKPYIMSHSAANTPVSFARGMGGKPRTYVSEPSTGGASRFFPSFKFESKARGGERPEANGVQHPTVKPLALMQWLIRLVTPVDGLILEPFAGSGTTLEAALLEGFEVIGVEREADYLPLIMQRLSRSQAPLISFGVIEAGERS